MNTNCVPKYLRSGQTQANNHLLKKSTYNKYTFIHRTSIQIDLFFPLLFSFFRNFSHWCYVDPHYCVLAYKSVRSILPAHPLIVCYNANQVQGSSANPAFSCTSCFSRYVSVNDSWLSLLFSPWWHSKKEHWLKCSARCAVEGGFFFLLNLKHMCTLSSSLQSPPHTVTELARACAGLWMKRSLSTGNGLNSKEERMAPVQRHSSLATHHHTLCTLASLPYRTSPALWFITKDCTIFQGESAALQNVHLCENGSSVWKMFVFTLG